MMTIAPASAKSLKNGTFFAIHDQPFFVNRQKYF